MDKNVTVQQPSEQAVPSVKNNDIGYKQIKNPDGSYKLEMGIAEQSLKKNIHNFMHDHFKIYRDYEWLNVSQIFQKLLAKSIPSLSPFLEYYKISLQLADNNLQAIKNNKNNIFYKYSDLQNNAFKNVIKEKIISSRNLNINDKSLEEKINNTYIISVNNNSSLTQQVINSNEFKEFINNNLDNIKSGKLKNKIISLEFKYDTSSYNNMSLYLTLHYVDIYNPHVDSKGNIVMDFIDNFDFEKWKYSVTFKLLLKQILNSDFDENNLSEIEKQIFKNLIIYINNNAAKQQELMHLCPFILHIPIKINNI